MFKTVMKLVKRIARINAKHREVGYDKSTTSIVIAGVENGWAGKCPGSLLDADNMVSLFKKTADNFDITVLKDKQATTTAWTSAVKNAVKKDLAIIYYSGHGGQDTSHNLGKANFEDDNANEFICLYDKPLLDDKIWNLINQSTGRVVCIWDCCHSATMFRTVNLTKRKTFNDFSGFLFAKSLLFAAQSKRDFSGMSLWNLSGCPDNEYSYGDANGGLLTNAILKYAKDYLTYDEVWKEIKSDCNLRKSEAAQKTEIGKPFNDKFFAQ